MSTKFIQRGWSVPLEGRERVLAACTIAREKIEIGDYDAGCAVLSQWWRLGEWPDQKGLSQVAAAELLLTTGVISDSVARAKQLSHGQRNAEVLLSGAIALFEHLGEETKVLESRIELGVSKTKFKNIAIQV